MIRSALFVFALVFSVPAMAADTLPVWVIDHNKSTLTFQAIQQGAAIEGEFGIFTGDIHFDPEKAGESTAKITVAMKTVDSKSPDRDQSLVGADWFAIDKFPESIYTVSKFEKLNDTQYVARGELSLRDVKKPLDLPLTITFSKDAEGNDVALAVGEVTLNRLDYGVGQGEWKDTNSVGDPVKVKVSVTAMKASAASLTSDCCKAP